MTILFSSQFLFSLNKKIKEGNKDDPIRVISYYEILQTCTCDVRVTDASFTTDE